jgi:flagellar biosynthesis/type III secretory pathway protein FliH
MENSVKKVLAISALIAMAGALSAAPAWGADVASDAAQAKRQATVIPDLQKAAANAAGYKTSEVQVNSTAHQVTIKVVDSKLNGAGAADRNAEASKIASAVAKAIAGKPDFAQVMTIHVDYLKQAGNSTAVVQGIDFNKTPDGAFTLHRT